MEAKDYMNKKDLGHIQTGTGVSGVRGLAKVEQWRTEPKIRWKITRKREGGGGVA